MAHLCTTSWYLCALPGATFAYRQKGNGAGIRSPLTPLYSGLSSFFPESSITSVISLLKSAAFLEVITGLPVVDSISFAYV